MFWRVLSPRVLRTRHRFSSPGYRLYTLCFHPTKNVRKSEEFIFEEYQILEARLAGADTVLLIVKMLDEEQLTRLYKYSLSLGMEPLVEVQNAEEMATAVKLGSKVIGVNNRNLESFEVDLSTTSRLRSLVPKETIICALSGINTHDDVVANHKDGVNAILVGEAIMRAPDASQFIQQLCSGQTTAQETKPAPLLVKICGTRTSEAAIAAAEAGADLIGMILVPGRKRTVADSAAKAISDAIHQFSRSSSSSSPSTTPIIPANTATDFFSASALRLRSFSSAARPLLVGVFLDQPLSEVLSLTARYSLDAVQLHGREPLEWAASIPVPVLRRFAPGEPGLGSRGHHALPLLDSGSAGGSGQLLDAVAIKAALEGGSDPDLRVLLAGGLSPENVADVVGAAGADARARIAGVDVSSGVEGPDGAQSLERIREFVRAAKGIN